MRKTERANYARRCTCCRRASKSAFRCVHTEMPVLAAAACWSWNSFTSRSHLCLRVALCLFPSAFPLRLLSYSRFSLNGFSYSRTFIIVRHSPHSGSHFLLSPFLSLSRLNLYNFFLSLRLSYTQHKLSTNCHCCHSIDFLRPPLLRPICLSIAKIEKCRC